MIARIPVALGRAIAARLEFRLLVVLMIAAGGLWGFVELLDEVRDGDAADIDRALLLALRNPADLADPIGPPWLETMMTELTALGGTTALTLITLLAIGYLVIDRKPAAAGFLLVAIGGGTLLAYGLKALVQRPRPDLVGHLVKVETASFPSGHAMMSAVTFITLGALLSRVQERRRMRAYILGVATAMMLAIGFSRVYLGVHWPSDVLAGWCLGVAWAILCWLAAIWLQRRGRIEAVRDTEP